MVEDRLLERLELLKQPPRVVLDVGAGPGRGAAALRQRYSGAQVIALDWAMPMLHAARAKRTWWRPFTRVCGDAMALPLAERSVDVLFSSLCMQWCPEPRALFAEWRRVLKPGGLLLFASFGPDTLQELRAAWAQVDSDPHVNVFLDMHDVGDALLASGFRDPVLETDRFNLQYADVPALLRELKAIGASNAHADRHAGLDVRARLKQMIAAYPTPPDGGISASFEVVYGQAFAPPDGAPIRSDAGEIASFSVQLLKRGKLRSGQ